MSEKHVFLPWQLEVAATETLAQPCPKGFNLPPQIPKTSILLESAQADFVFVAANSIRPASLDFSRRSFIACFNNPSVLPDIANAIAHNPSVSPHNPFVLSHIANAIGHNPFAMPDNAIVMPHIVFVSPHNRIASCHIASAWRDIAFARARASLPRCVN